MLDYYVRSSATMAPSKTSAVTRRSTRVAVKKSVASASVKESALTTSAARGRQKATKVVSIAKVGLASRTGKASKKGPEVVSRDHCSRSFDVRSPVGDDYQGQLLSVQLPSWFLSHLSFSHSVRWRAGGRHGLMTTCSDYAAEGANYCTWMSPLSRCLQCHNSITAV